MKRAVIRARLRAWDLRFEGHQYVVGGGMTKWPTTWCRKSLERHLTETYAGAGGCHHRRRACDPKRLSVQS